MDTKIYTWSDVSIRMGGVDITSAQDVSYKETQAKEAVYGKGNEPIAIQRGQKSYEGKITLLQNEYEALVAATKNKSLLDISFDMVVSYGKTENGDKIITDVLHGCEITDTENKIGNTDQKMVVELPFICLKMTRQK